jgi:hypothetical protein
MDEVQDSDFIYLKNKDVKEVRKSLLEDQNGKCKLCGNIITPETGVALDHQHKRKMDPIGLDGGGLIRGVLCRGCNILEGKLWNSMVRYLQPKNVQERIDWLETLIEYYQEENTNLVHPNEAPKEPKLPKRQFNKLNKYYSEKYPKRIPLVYPKSGKWTKKLRNIQDELDIIESSEEVK